MYRACQAVLGQASRLWRVQPGTWRSHSGHRFRVRSHGHGVRGLSSASEPAPRPAEDGAAGGARSADGASAAAGGARRPSLLARVLCAVGKRMPKQGASDANSKEDTGAGFDGDPATIGRLLRLARPERKALTIAMGTLVLTSGASLVFPAAVGRILDSALGDAAIYTPTEIAFGLLGLFTVQAGLIVARGIYLKVAGERISARLRRQVFNRMVEQEIAFWDGQSTGNIINRLSADVLMVQRSLTEDIVGAIRNGSMVIGSTVLVFTISPKLALVSVGIIPPISLVGLAYSRYVKRQQNEVQEALGETMEVAESVEKMRFKDRVDRTFDFARKVAIASSTFEGSMHMATNVALVSVLGYGGNLVLAGSLSAGQLTSFLMYSLYAGINLGSMANSFSKLMLAVGASNRVFQIIDREPRIPIAGGATLPHFNGNVTFEDVSFSYPQRPDDRVLHNFHLELRPGHTVALVGASGSGKSTVAALLTRLYDADAGVVRYDGRDVRELDPSWVRTVVGVVPQEPTMFATSIADNIRYGYPEATDEEVVAAAKLANAHDFIMSLPDGYETMVGERGVLLSGGQKQRCAIARAIIKNPAVLILDEATSALDAQSEAVVQEALEKAATGRSVVAIAHRLSSMRNADEIAVLEDGRVVQRGPFDELVKAEGAFANLVWQQFT